MKKIIINNDSKQYCFYINDLNETPEVYNIGDIVDWNYNKDIPTKGKLLDDVYWTEDVNTAVLIKNHIVNSVFVYPATFDYNVFIKENNILTYDPNWWSDEQWNAWLNPANPLIIPKHILDNPKKYIPKGNYCYYADPENHFVNDYLELCVCPFWQIDESKPIQENGYCHYLKYGDWYDNFGLIWDQLKICGENL